MDRAIRLLWLLASIAFAPSAVMAHSYIVGALKIEHPWSRPTPISALTAVGYLVISNTGAAPDRFLGGKSPFAAQIQIHLMSMDRGIMRMRPVDGGMVLPPHGTVRFEPGGYHLMLVAPKRPFRIGDRIPATLLFARAGALHVEFYVQAEAPGDGQDRMSGMGSH